MTQSLPTVQIADGDDGYLVINARDFDPRRHTLFGDDAPAESEPTPRETLLAINGIGPSTADRLLALGIADATALAAADAADLVERANHRTVTAETVADWQAQLTASETQTAD